VGRLELRSHSKPFAGIVIEKNCLVAEPELDEKRAGAFDRRGVGK
jgi:hypothetical protein